MDDEDAALRSWSSARLSIAVVTVPVTQTMARITPGCDPKSETNEALDVRLDIDECATNNGECGPVYRFVCQNNQGAASPTSSDRRDNLQESCVAVEEPGANPPQSGTVWFSPDISPRATRHPS